MRQLSLRNEWSKVQDWREITDHFGGIYGIYLKSTKKTERSQHVINPGRTWKLCPEISPDTDLPSPLLVAAVVCVTISNISNAFSKGLSLVGVIGNKSMWKSSVYTRPAKYHPLNPLLAAVSRFTSAVLN